MHCMSMKSANTSSRELRMVWGGLPLPSHRFKLRRSFFRSAARFLEARQQLLSAEVEIRDHFDPVLCLVGELDQCKEMGYILEEAADAKLSF